MNRYACHFVENHGCILLNATDDEEVAWLAEAHARIEVTRISDIIPLDMHHYVPETPDLYEE